ncbi:MAG: tetratricopeptide repeat protein [Planctomycetes bacterium]|nr:tetratricopeptide repeat protein [Planctomycetota bacterium]
METPSRNTVQPLLSLGAVGPRTDFDGSPAIREIRAWLDDPRAPATLWLRGPPGSGRTTAVAAALRRPGPAPRHAKRIACWAGTSLGEVLEDAATTLRQVGSESLARALAQRSQLASKIAVLFRALEESSVTLWLDDFDALLLEEGAPWPAGEAMSSFLEGCRALDGRSARIVIVSDLDVEVSADTGYRLVDLQGSPGPEGVDATIASLGPDARAVLDAAAVLPPEPSRQSLRDVSAALGVRLDLDSGEDDAPLRELASRRLAALPPRGALEQPRAAPLVVAGLVRRRVEDRLRRDEPERWRSLQAAAGAYFLRLAGRSGSLWHFAAAWRAYSLAGAHDDAYQVQKLFLQDLVHRGDLDAARHVLEETARTATGPNRTVALGNLAIVHKNAGDHDRALEIYSEVAAEFTRLGDAANVARVHHQIGNTHYARGSYALALESYRRSLDVSGALGDKPAATVTRIQIANVHYQRGEREEALRDYLEALDEARVLENGALAAAVELQVGQIHFQERRYVEADAHLKEAETLGRSCGDLRTLLKALEARGTVARERREYDAARSLFDGAVTTAEALGDGHEAASALLLAGEVERQRLQPAEALHCYERARALLARHGALTGISAGDREPLGREIEERVRSLAEELGDEAFARIARRAPGRGRPQQPE